MALDIALEQERLKAEQELLAQEEDAAASINNELAVQDRMRTNVEETSPETREMEFDIDFVQDLKYIIERVEQADEDLRVIRTRFFKLLCAYFEGNQLGIWNAELNDWQNILERTELIDDDEEDVLSSAKCANVFRSWIINVIAALTSGTPKVKYIPADAEETADIDTAKAYQLIQRKIENQKHSKPKQIITKTLKIKFTQGLVFAYVYPKQDSKLGYYNEPVKKSRETQQYSINCLSCGAEMASGELTPEIMQALPEIENRAVECPQCKSMEPPIANVTNEVKEEIVDYNQIPKHRICVDLYGPLNAEIPFFVTSLQQVPILRLKTEMHYAEAAEKFDLDIVEPQADTDGERDMRMPIGYVSSANEVVTVEQVWYRNWSFNIITDYDRRESMKQQFPKGCYAVFIDDKLVEYFEEDMDEHWTTTEDPISDFLHAVPEAQDSKDIQDMINEMLNLTMDTIEHNIPELYVRAQTLDLDKYKSVRSRPGNVTAVNARPGIANIGADFFQSHTSSLSQEHAIFHGKLMELGQQLSKSMPTIYGGTIKGGSGTAREYEASRAMSLQALGILWDTVKEFYAAIMNLAVPQYAELMLEDEKYVQDLGNDRYINVYIQKSKLVGSVGEITCDTNEQIPISWAEQRDVLMQMIGMQNPVIGQILAHPQNASFVASRIGMQELYIPGDEDRQKQLAEIERMIKEQPVPNPAFIQYQQFMMSPEGQMQAGLAQINGQPIPPPPPQFISSVQPNFKLDNHTIEKDTCATWLKSSTGRALQEINEPGWQNVFLHFLEHEQMEMMKMQEDMQKQMMIQGMQQGMGQQNAQESPAQ